MREPDDLFWPLRGGTPKERRRAGLYLIFYLALLGAAYKLTWALAPWFE